MSVNEPGDGIAVERVQATLVQRGAKWQAAPNHLTEQPAERRRLYLGFSPPAGLTLRDLEARGKDLAFAPRAGLQAPSYPAAFDWRNRNGQNFITPIKDQGPCGSCVAFGTTAAVEGTLRAQRGDPSLAVDLSEASLFYCIGASQGRNCGTGWWP